jgi:hypothetical protein
MIESTDKLEENRKELRKLSADLKIESLRFWIRPEDSSISLEQLQSEILLVLKNFRDGVGIVPANGKCL